MPAAFVFLARIARAIPLRLGIRNFRPQKGGVKFQGISGEIQKFQGKFQELEVAFIAAGEYSEGIIPSGIPKEFQGIPEAIFGFLGIWFMEFQCAVPLASGRASVIRPGNRNFLEEFPPKFHSET